MPPPNITGRLHLGHALDLSLQDTIIRAYASRGAETKWTPGCDHAGIATHEKIMAELSLTELPLSATDMSRYEIKAESWTDEHRKIIMKQFKALNPHASWSDERFTLDSRYYKTCREALSQFGKAGKLSLKNGSLFLNLTKEAREMIGAIERGELEIHPESHKNRLIKMLQEDREWDIGRTIPWGHKFSFAGFPAEITDGNSGQQFTMDTWFSSGLWPTAIPDNPLRGFDGLIIGYDILFFWAARMWMMHYALHGLAPFKKIHLHGLIRDAQGRKFSKSLGNGIDPLDLIKSHGSDTLRIWCLEHAAWGRDFKFDPSNFQKSGMLLTKMLNASRLILSSELLAEDDIKIIENLPSEIDWDEMEAELFKKIKDFDLENAWKYIRTACWSEWCEGWLAKNKTGFNDPEILGKAIAGQKRLLQMLHPFAPASTWWISQKINGII